MFNKSPLLSVFFFALAVAALWIPYFLAAPPVPAYSHCMPFEYWVLRYAEVYPILSSITAALTFLVGAALLTTIKRRYLVASQPNNTVPFIYLLLFFAFPAQKNITGAHIASLLYLASVLMLFHISKSSKAYSLFFYIGMLMACSVLFSAAAIFWLILLPIMLNLFRHSFSLNEFVIMLAGAFTPFFYACITYYFAENNAALFFTTLHDNLFSASSSWIVKDGYATEKTYWIFILFIVLQASWLMGKKLFVPHKITRYYKLFLWSFYIMFFVSLISDNPVMLMPMIAVPASLLIACYFTVTQKRKWGALQLAFLIAFTLWIQYH